MSSYLAVTGAVVAVVGAATTIAFSWWNVRMAERAQRMAEQAQRVAAYRSVHELYDKMVQLKFDNPGFLIRAREWDEDKMPCVFNEADSHHKAWSQYYTFVELCIGFANAVLQAHEDTLMGDSEFDKQWEPLVRLVVAEHYPIISQFVGEGPYLSQYLRDYIAATAAIEGWNWNDEHEALDWRRGREVEAV